MGEGEGGRLGGLWELVGGSEHVLVHVWFRSCVGFLVLERCDLPEMAFVSFDVWDGGWTTESC